MTFFFKGTCNFSGTLALFFEPYRIFYEYTLTDSSRKAVYNINITLYLFFCNTGTLIGPRKFRRNSDNYYIFSCFYSFSVSLLKCQGHNLACCREFIALNKFFIKFFVCNIHTVNIFCITKAQSHRKYSNLFCNPLCQIGCRVNNYSYFFI